MLLYVSKFLDLIILLMFPSQLYIVRITGKSLVILAIRSLRDTDTQEELTG